MVHPSSYGCEVLKFDYKGATVPHLTLYSEVLLANKPTDVVIHVGCNDIWGRRRRNVASQQIAQEILQLVQKCKQNGVARVYVSTLFVTKVAASNTQKEEINTMLRRLCTNHGFKLIDNNEVEVCHLGDEVHLDPPSKRWFNEHLPKHRQ